MNVNSTDLNIADRIAYEDNHILIFDKLPGQIVQGDKTGDKPLSEILKDYIKERDSKPGNVFLGVVHRLDRPAGGLTIFAKTSKALERLNAMFQSRDIDKEYLAIVTALPKPQSGTLKHFMTKNEVKNKSMVYENEKSGSKLAHLDYHLLASGDRFHLLRIQLYTGRHHQIRAQLAHIGCPIRGDLKYGAKRSNPNGGIDLIAYKISFIHPVKNEQIEVRATLPKENLWNFFSSYVG